MQKHSILLSVSLSNLATINSEQSNFVILVLNRNCILHKFNVPQNAQVFHVISA